jgi:uncharacterized membrane protein YqjE
MESEAATEDVPPLAKSARRFAHRLFVTCENRLQLLMVEAEEERERILRAILMAMIASVFGLLAGISVTVIVAVAFWDHNPVIALLVLTAVYIILALLFLTRLMHLQRDWQMLPTTLEQLKKDRECLEKQLS